MPSIETVDCRQTAILWPVLGYDKRGQPVLGPPVELKPPYNGVRWIQKRTQKLAPDGTTIMLDATVIACQDIIVGSQMWLGTMEDWLGSSEGSASNDEELHEVKTFNPTVDIRNVFTRREVGLMRKHNK